MNCGGRFRFSPVCLEAWTRGTYLSRTVAPKIDGRPATGAAWRLYWPSVRLHYALSNAALHDLLGEVTELAECAALEMLCTLTGTQGSNPCLSATRYARLRGGLSPFSAEPK